MLKGPKHVLEITVSSNSHWHFPVWHLRVDQLTLPAMKGQPLQALSSLCLHCVTAGPALVLWAEAQSLQFPLYDHVFLLPGWKKMHADAEHVADRS